SRRWKGAAGLRRWTSEGETSWHLREWLKANCPALGRSPPATRKSKARCGALPQRAFPSSSPGVRVRGLRLLERRLDGALGHDGNEVSAVLGARVQVAVQAFGAHLHVRHRFRCELRRERLFHVLLPEGAGPRASDAHAHVA